MKSKLFIASLLAMAMAACADLGFGVDVDSGYDYNPYYYNGGYYGYPWGNLEWDWDYPLYNPPVQRPPRPPMIGGGPGPVIPKPPQNQPPQNNPPQVRPPMNGVPSTGPGGIQRPGNGGMPSAPVPNTAPVQNNGSNNANRGR